MNVLNREKLKGAGVLIESDRRELWSRKDEHLVWKSSLNAMLEDLNNRAYLLDLLRIYEASVRSGMKTLRDHLETELQMFRLLNRDSFSGLMLLMSGASGTPHALSWVTAANITSDSRTEY